MEDFASDSDYGGVVLHPLPGHTGNTGKPCLLENAVARLSVRIGTISLLLTAGFLLCVTLREANVLPRGADLGPVKESVASHIMSLSRESTYPIARLHAAADSDRYVLVFDAGSSGSRLHIFKHNGVEMKEIMPNSSDSSKFKTSPGISSYVNDPKAACPGFTNMLDVATDYVPKSQQQGTQMYLLATAGMRLLNYPDIAIVLQAVSECLIEYSETNKAFILEAAETLSGNEEGLFSWLTTNYVKGTLGDLTTSVGVMDMGGASMQISFAAQVNILDGKFSFYVDGRLQSIYAKSYMRYGNDQAWQRLLELLVSREAPAVKVVDNPCSLVGDDEPMTVLGRDITFRGTGSARLCLSLTGSLLNVLGECNVGPCAIGGAYEPPLPPFMNFYAISSFFQCRTKSRTHSTRRDSSSNQPTSNHRGFSDVLRSHS